MNANDDSQDVVTTQYSAGRTHYHTTDCRMAQNITDRKVVSETYAKERMGLEKCAYCSGEFDQGTSTHDVYRRLVKMGEADAD